MKRGRKPKPTALKIAQGNPGHRPIGAETEPAGPAGVPVWPEEIKNPVAQKHFFALLPMLQEMGVVSRIDGDALVNYCLAYARKIKAENELAKKGAGEMVKVGSQMQPNYWLSIANKAVEEMRKIGAEFGLTPSSRTSLKVLPKKEPSGLEKFLNGEAG